MERKKHLALVYGLGMGAALAGIMSQRQDATTFETLDEGPRRFAEFPSDGGMYVDTQPRPSGIGKPWPGSGVDRSKVKAARKQSRQNKRKRK